MSSNIPIKYLKTLSIAYIIGSRRQFSGSRYDQKGLDLDIKCLKWQHKNLREIMTGPVVVKDRQLFSSLTKKMASRGRRLAQGAMAGKKALDKKTKEVQYLKTIIPCGKAAAAPPLGPQLGQLGVPIAAFCREFNEKTAQFKPGVPMRTSITVNPDRTYKIDLVSPPTTYFLKQAAGIQKAAMKGGDEIAGKITLKHLYEIAVVKSQDPSFAGMSLENVCKSLVGTARTCGIKIVPSLDAEEYGQFLRERLEWVKEEENRLDELRQAKMLRL